MSNDSMYFKIRSHPLVKYTLIMMMFLILLIGIRMLWGKMFPIPDSPAISKGVVDLTNWDFNQSDAMLLNGEWAFYPDQLDGLVDGEPQYVQVPGNWGQGRSGGAEYGYGTYRLTILLGESAEEQSYAFWFKRIEAASQVELNGQINTMFGKLATGKEYYEPSRKGYTASYSAASGERSIEVLIRVANFDNPLYGGIVDPIRFGSQASIDFARLYSIGFQMIVFVILLLHGIYAIILYGFDRRQVAFLVFFMLLLASALSIVSSHDRLILLWLPINYTWSVKLTILSYLSLTYFMLMLTRIFSRSESDKHWFRAFSVVLALYLACLIVLPIDLVQYMLHYYVNQFLYVFPVFWFVYLIGKMMIHNRNGAIFLLVAAIGVLSSIVWGIFTSYGLYYIEYYPIDIIAAIVGFSAYWFKLFYRNTAENAKLNEQLKQSDKLKDQFLAHTSHELRTPIHGIMNIAQTVALRERQTMDDRSYKDMELLMTIGRRMSHLLEDLLDLVRLKDKHVVLQERPLHLQSIAEGVISMLNYLVEHKQVVLTSRIPDDFPAVIADEKRLTQILFNLIHNAIKYTAQGEIAVTAELRQDRVFIIVSDTGIGMNEATLERVFLPYEQAQPGSSGIGLGLSICKQLAELHGGTLTVRSRAGKGTEFQFSVTIASSQPPAGVPTGEGSSPSWEEPSPQAYPLLTQADSGNWLELAAATMSAPAEKQHILAIDDDPVNLKVLTGILSNDTYQITTVASAYEALELLDRSQWDIVISDVMMPGMSGYELTRLIRERYSISELPVLLLTARSQSADIYAGFSAGANDYLSKPVDALELKYRVWSLAMLKRSVRERLRMEAAYLQAQIHPHFLFNTLSSILALSDIDADKMRKLADAFTSYLRISFNFLNAGELVSLTHELELTQSYLYIEKERFEERLNVQWEIDSGIYLLLPPLTLQPLVENAVKHGALGRSSGGTVRIEIIRRDADTVFEISDDGRGMNQQEADGLLLHAFGGSGGIGIANTHRRLKQRYGQGLSIRSAPDVGTTVSFVIPD